MLGDGYRVVYHCENIDIFDGCYEPDSGPAYCQGVDEEKDDYNGLTD